MRRPSTKERADPDHVVRASRRVRGDLGDLRVLLTDQFTGDSRILFRRNVKESARAGAVPHARQRPLRGDRRRAHQVDRGRLHDERPLPYSEPVTLGGGERGATSTSVNYVRNSVKAGRRRVRRRRDAVRRGRGGPDPRGVARHLPEAVHRHGRDAGEPARAPALPGGPVPAADRPLAPLPHGRRGGFPTRARTCGTSRRSTARRWSPTSSRSCRASSRRRCCWHGHSRPPTART